ncbi:MAG TPA: hypothetical protein PK566_14685 [Pseudobacteroides sp.]|nr:hypothetical protein [Pseudobacteroides sp.]
MFTDPFAAQIMEALVAGGVGIAGIIGVIIFLVLKYRVKVEQIKAMQ